jgi:NitT/TauT family transport system substrate-binding protein
MARISDTKLTRRQLLKAGGLGAASLAGANLILKPGFARGQRVTELKMAYLPLASFAGVFLADDLGYLREVGIKVKYERVPAAAKSMAFLTTGQLDMAAGGISAALYNAVLRGLTIKVVADKGTYLPDIPNSAAMMVRKDLYDKGLRTLKDWKGLKVASSATANVTHYHIDNALATVGLSDKDIEMVTMRFPQMPAAMESKAVEACEAVEPFRTMMIEKGVAVQVADMGEIFPLQQYAVIFYGEKFIKEKGELAQGFMDAYIKGIRKYYEFGPRHETVVASLVNHTPLKAGLLKKINPAWIDINGAVNAKNLDHQQTWYIKKGFVPRRADINKLVEKTFLEATWKKLGKKKHPGKEYWERVKMG